MQISHDFVALEQFAEDPEGPRIVLDTKQAELWKVLNDPVDISGPSTPTLAFVTSQASDHALIRLQRVSMPASFSTVVAFSAAVGIYIGNALPKGVKRVHLVIGVTAEDDNESDANQAWLGIAVQTK